MGQLADSKDAEDNNGRDNDQDANDTDCEDDGDEGKKGLRNTRRGGSPTREVILMLRLFHELLVHSLVVL
jgi:hypothetical protein